MQKEILTYRVYWDEESFIATVEASFHIERNHGADADGRRGAPRTFIDDVLIVKVTDDAGNDHGLSFARSVLRYFYTRQFFQSRFEVV